LATPEDPSTQIIRTSTVHFTIEDEGTFTTPWTATTIYLRGGPELPEEVCAENTFGFHYDKEGGIPHADIADF
jgi:hypothetical protein